MTRRTRFQQALYFVRWQLWPIVIALPGHLMFIARGAGGAQCGLTTRAQLALQAISIHLRLECGHNPLELLRIMEEIIELPASQVGVIVECGSYLGGSTAKLSHAAAVARRRLIVCDSFEGLPQVSAENHSDVKSDFLKGQYVGRLDQVQSNLRRFGRDGMVTFVPGWYDSSLKQLAGQPIACAFWDVDLKESFQTCISALWSDIQPGAKVFIHDVDRRPVVDAFTDASWWQEHIGTLPPRLVGGFSGIGPLSPTLGHITKA